MVTLVWGNDEINALKPTKVIALEPSIKSYKVVAKQTQAKKPATHEDEKLLLYFFW